MITEEMKAIQMLDNCKEQYISAGIGIKTDGNFVTIHYYAQIRNNEVLLSIRDLNRINEIVKSAKELSQNGRKGK